MESRVHLGYIWRSKFLLWSLKVLGPNCKSKFLNIFHSDTQWNEIHSKPCPICFQLVFRTQNFDVSRMAQGKAALILYNQSMGVQRLILKMPLAPITDYFAVKMSLRNGRERSMWHKLCPSSVQAVFRGFWGLENLPFQGRHKERLHQLCAIRREAN